MSFLPFCFRRATAPEYPPLAILKRTDYQCIASFRISFEIRYTADTAKKTLTHTMKRTIFQSLLKRFALLALAAGTVFATSVSLTACGGGGNEETRGSITYNQLLNGGKIIYLQAGSGMILRGDPGLMDSGTLPWGYCYPAGMGLSANPQAFQAVFYGIQIPEDKTTKITGTITCKIGYSGASYSEDTGFGAFMGFPSGLRPQIQLSRPMELKLNFDTREWTMALPEQTIVVYYLGSSRSIGTVVEGDKWQGVNLGTGEEAPTSKKEGFFDIMVAQ